MKTCHGNTARVRDQRAGTTGSTDSGGGILLGSTSHRKSLLRACSDVQRRAGSRVSMRSSRSRADPGKLGCGEIFYIHCSSSSSREKRKLVSTLSTYKANSSRRRRRYCFLGFIVLKRGSLMTSGQTAGQGLPHNRLTGGIIGRCQRKKEEQKKYS